MKNYYKILGVKKEASADEIKNAFRALAQKYHPDRNGGKDAVKKFQEVNEAYQTLSDEHKRNVYNYDLMRAEQGTQTSNSTGTTDERSYRPPEYYQRPQSYRGTQTKARKPRPRWLQALFDIFQLVSWSLGGAALGGLLVLGQRSVMGLDSLWQTSGVLFGVFCGALAAVTLPTENKLEQQLRARFKDGYNLLRSIGSCLAGAFFGGVLGELVSFQFDLYLDNGAYIGIVAGCVLFGWIANEEAFWTKLRLPRAYFEMAFTLVRTLGIALLAAGISLVIGLFLESFEVVTEIFPAAFYGFIVGVIVGSMTPSDLLAYARYASAYVGRFMVILIVLLALLLGFISGVWLQEPIKNLFVS